MAVIYFDSHDTDEIRRERLFSGDIYVFGPTKTTLEFSDFARSLISQAFGELDPETAQYTMEVTEYAKLLGQLKPAFIHHPESKRFLQHILRERGCNAEETYFEVPKMRSSTSDGYLTAGIAYAWHPHRDTWYSAPHCQINWWIPLYDVESTNCIASILVTGRTQCQILQKDITITTGI